MHKDVEGQNREQDCEKDRWSEKEGRTSRKGHATNRKTAVSILVCLKRLELGTEHPRVPLSEDLDSGLPTVLIAQKLLKCRDCILTAFWKLRRAALGEGLGSCEVKQICWNPTLNRGAGE